MLSQWQLWLCQPLPFCLLLLVELSLETSPKLTVLVTLDFQEAGEFQLLTSGFHLLEAAVLDRCDFLGLIMSDLPQCFHDLGSKPLHLRACHLP